MKEKIAAHPDPDSKVVHPAKKRKYVYPVRDWKDYAGESLMIIFSVLLALGLTEYINKSHDRENTRNTLKSISEELKHNKTAVTEMQVYNLRVLARIDSVLSDKRIQKKFVAKGEIHLDIIAPDGVLYRYFEKDAWAVAKSNNIMSKIDIESVSLITKVYEDLERMSKVEDEVARVIFDWQSRDAANIRTTLILIRDLYHGWAVDREPRLLTEIEAALTKIDSPSGSVTR